MGSRNRWGFGTVGLATCLALWLLTATGAGGASLPGLYLPLVVVGQPPVPSPTPTATWTPTPTATPTPTPTATCTPADDPAREDALADLINQERTSRGLAALTLAPELTQSARGHSHDMADHDFVSHVGSDGSTPDQRMQAAGYQPTYWGETIAAGLSDPADVVAGWMNSRPHRAIILSDEFEDFGVGYARNPWSTYTHYWTADFGRRAN